jgi:hypothetical protein
LRYPQISLIRCRRCRRATKAASTVITAFPIAQQAFADPAKAELDSMLPGFRFLFAAIMLSMSILVFGLGATALLRTAHDDFANTPSWQPAPETRFAQQNDATKPLLAMLRVDEPAVAAPAEQRLPDDAAAPAESVSAGSTPGESETSAALNPEQSPQPEATKPEIPASEAPEQAETAPADAPAAADQTKTGATEQAVPPAKEAVGDLEEAAPREAIPTAPEQASVPGSPDTGGASTRIATLGGPPVAIEAKATASAKLDKSAIKKREQALRAIKRRRAARARLAAQAAQQWLDPFALPSASDHRR